MKRTILYLGLAALLAVACAKDPVEGKNDDAKLYFDSWMQVHHPGAARTPLGAGIISESSGTGAAAGSAEANPFIRVRYTIRDLAGAIQSTSEELTARQLGTYEEENYYGPATWVRSNNGLLPGVEESISQMSCGGKRTVVIPGWLLGGTDRYKSAQEYLDNVTGTPMIYELELDEVISDIGKWETDSIGRYVARNFPGKSVQDSLKYGFYYFRTGQPSSEESFKKDTTIYVNYIGRRLDGTVFDTNVKDTAKFYGLYSASRNYGPAAIKWYGDDQTYTDIKMTAYQSSSSSSVIDGFSYALDKMHPYEKGTAVFYSTMGYKSTGSGSTIPGYSPLRFDFEIVDKP